MKSKIIPNSNLTKTDEKKFYAFIAMLLSVVGFILAMLVKKDDKYVMFYAKQSLILFFIFIFISALGYVLKLIQFFGEIIYGIIIVFVAVVWIFGMIYALSGNEIKLPLIGNFDKYLKF